MTEHKSTPQFAKCQAPTLNPALDSRWKYFKSLHGKVLAACFDSPILANSPHFIEITHFEYEQSIKELQS